MVPLQPPSKRRWRSCSASRRKKPWCRQRRSISSTSARVKGAAAGFGASGESLMALSGRVKGPIIVTGSADANPAPLANALEPLEELPSLLAQGLVGGFAVGAGFPFHGAAGVLPGLVDAPLVLQEGGVVEVDVDTIGTHGERALEHALGSVAVAEAHRAARGAIVEGAQGHVGGAVGAVGVELDGALQGVPGAACAGERPQAAALPGI